MDKLTSLTGLISSGGFQALKAAERDRNCAPNVEKQILKLHVKQL
jgi:hypothetical protein